MSSRSESGKSVGKRPRGRQPTVDPHLVVGAADAYRAQFTQAWPTLGKRLLAAGTAVALWEVVKSGNGIISNMHDFTFSERIFEILRDPKFPRKRDKSQIHFLADSLGAYGAVTTRRSREICVAERTKVRHVIVRREHYIECTCTYKGPARDGGCPSCGTAELSDDLRRKEVEG